MKFIHLYIFQIIKLFGYNILTKFQLAIFKVNWRLVNKNNDTIPVKVFPIGLVNVGDYTYGPIDVYPYCSKNEGLIIGRYCSIAKDVKFILGGNHSLTNLMTYPINNKLISSNINDSYSKGHIILGDDVWIGFGSIILSGVILGDGCVVAAGSVVTKSFPPFSIIGGNPARLIKMRFDEDVVNELMLSKFSFSNLSACFVKDNIDLLNQRLDIDVFNQIENKINKL